MARVYLTQDLRTLAQRALHGSYITTIIVIVCVAPTPVFITLSSPQRFYLVSEEKRFGTIEEIKETIAD